MERLSDSERDRLGRLVEALDCDCVRLHRGGGGLHRTRRAVLWASRGRAIALGNHVFLPDRCANDLATLAHELTHCSQYQRWGAWRYFSRGAAAQLRDLLHRVVGVGASPYRYEVEPGKPFEAYGMEQQAQMVEDALRAQQGYEAPSA
jgi:uncharacterized protein DUF4157